MKRSILSIVAAGMLMMVSGRADAAMTPPPLVVDGMVEQVRLVCSRINCHDPRTGQYTYSGCDHRGCYPTSGFIGVLPGYGYGGGYGPPQQNYGYRRQREYYSY